MRIALFTETYLPSINGVVTHVKTLKEGLEALTEIDEQEFRGYRRFKSKQSRYC